MYKQCHRIKSSLRKGDIPEVNGGLTLHALLFYSTIHFYIIKFFFCLKFSIVYICMVKLYIYQLFHITSRFFISFWWEFFLLKVRFVNKILNFSFMENKKYLKQHNGIVVSHCIISVFFLVLYNILCVVDWINV